MTCSVNNSASSVHALMLSPGKAFLLVTIGLVLGGVHLIAPGAQSHKHPAATQHSTGLDFSSGSVCREHALRHLTNTQRPPHKTLTPGCGFAHLIDQVRTAEMDNAETTSTPALAPSFAVNEAAQVSTWAPSWVQQECDLLSYPVNNYFHAALAASGPHPQREDPFTEAGGLRWLKLVFKLMICALGPASLVGKSKPRR